MGRGFAGLQGALYCGTGCFHRRKVIYGVYPDDNGAPRNSNSADINGNNSNSAGLPFDYVDDIYIIYLCKNR